MSSQLTRRTAQPRRSGRRATWLTDVHDSLTATFTEHVQERFRHHNTNSTRPVSTDGPTCWCWSAPHDKSLFLYTPYRCAYVVVHAIHRRKGPIKDHRGARLPREAATRCRSTMKFERPARPPPCHARFCHRAATYSCTIGLGLRRTDDTLPVNQAPHAHNHRETSGGFCSFRASTGSTGSP